jgi:hypothetical protein
VIQFLFPYQCFFTLLTVPFFLSETGVSTQTHQEILQRQLQSIKKGVRDGIHFIFIVCLREGNYWGSKMH